MIQIQLNGTLKQTADDTPLFEFLAQENLNPKLIAIEFNGEILHRQHWDGQTLSNGDRLEVVTIVGGG
ncbi:MAG: sulfur carrier protein ThiS [Cyanobacteria bacterium P01_F01_bin.42]